MKCLDCGSYEISWNIERGYAIKTYDEAGNEIDSDFDCQSLNLPVCQKCGGDNLEGPNVKLSRM